jgi:hypothetical protein
MSQALRFSDMAALAADLRAQRDELLDALQGLTKFIYDQNWSAPGLVAHLHDADEAITKATNSTEQRVSP